MLSVDWLRRAMDAVLRDISAAGSSAASYGIIGAAIATGTGLGVAAALVSVAAGFERRLFDGGGLSGGQAQPRHETGSQVEGKSASAEVLTQEAI